MKFYIENNEALPAIQVLDDPDPAPVGYTLLVETIENVNSYWRKGYNYPACTKIIADLFTAKTGTTELEKWDSCTPPEKVVLVERQVVSKNLRLTIVSGVEDKDFFNIHAKNSISARGAAIDECKILIAYNLSVADRKDLFGDVGAKIAGYVEANDPDLSNWFNSVGPYVDGGFKIKPYFSTEILNMFISTVDNGVLG